MTKEELLQRLTEIEWDDFECKAARERLTNGKVDFASDLVSSTITYWFGEQVLVNNIVNKLVNNLVNKLVVE
jgi:hypothetical protein